MFSESNPYAIVSLIVAPAILTNACSMLAMSTSNRLARAVDRARELSKLLEPVEDYGLPQATRRLAELSATEQRSLLLLRALRSFYTALGAFAAAALLALLVVVLAPTELRVFMPQSAMAVLVAIAVFSSLVAVGALVHGSVTLVRETRIAVQTLRERAALVRARAGTDD